MTTFPKTIALLEEVNLSHPVQDVSPHGISAIGYLRLHPLDNTPRFEPWPEGANGPAIFKQYMQETVHYTEERIGTENEQRGLAIVDLIDLCAGVSDRHGFHEEGKRLRHDIEQARADSFTEEEVERAEVNYRNYIANRLLLFVSEIIEAHDDLRQGYLIEAVWYENKRGERSQTQNDEFQKPCGPLSEIIDVLVRVFDLLGELGLAQEAARMFIQKVAYNDSRPYMHGKKF